MTNDIIHLTTLDDPGIAPYIRLTEAQLRSRQHPRNGTIIVESPKVITTALDAGYEPLSLMCEERHINGDASDIIQRIGNIPVYTGPRGLLANITGYTLTRGVLCAMRRPMPKAIDDVLTGGDKRKRIIVIDGVVDTTNIGSIFRSAAALGIDAILVKTNACDPFNRRAIRVSMGTVFRIPWTWLDVSETALHEYGFKTVAMALRNDSIALDDPLLKRVQRLALIMGNEGDGLADDTIKDADYVVRIPMSYGVDSLNVAAAAAIACWELKK